MDTTLIVLLAGLGLCVVGLLIWYETDRSKSETDEEVLDRITW
ncbi:hypothetical protein [Caballeronia sp. NK8]|nr:hypothetical protein [Caballeronia sp. NK8]